MRLMDKYTPVDYKDSVDKEFRTAKMMSPDYLFEMMFCAFPKPVKFLFKLRDILVRPFGLEGGNSFRNLIIEQKPEEIVLGKCDRHLCFWVGLYCSPIEDGMQKISVTTVVKFNNLLGRVYFVAIWVFHKIIVGILLRRSVKVYQKSAKLDKF